MRGIVMSLIVVCVVAALTEGKTVWMVSTKTGSNGIDKVVRIKLNSDTGASAFLPLADEQNNFERNSEEVYAVTTPTAVNISTVTSIDIKVDGGSLVLESLKVTNMDTDEVVLCEFNEETITKSSPALNVSCTVVPDKLPVYMLAIKTGNSGTDRRVSVNLVDKNGEETGYIYVNQEKINNWEANQTDYMPIYPSRGSYIKSLDEIVDVKVRLHQKSWLDGLSRADNWHLDSIVIAEVDPNTMQVSHPRYWLVCEFDVTFRVINTNKQAKSCHYNEIYTAFSDI